MAVFPSKLVQVLKMITLSGKKLLLSKSMKQGRKLDFMKVCLECYRYFLLWTTFLLYYLLFKEQKAQVSRQKAIEARTLIQETYIRHRVDGSGPADSTQTVDDQPGVRKFAKKKQNMSLTPTQKLEYIESAKEQTTELLRRESLQKVEREQKSRANAETFKQNAQERYLDKSKEGGNEGGLRKFASLKKSSGTPPNKPPRK